MKKVIIAGAGCGDIELLTLKTKKYIEKADVIVYDRLINEEILNFAKKNVEFIYMGKDNTDGGKLQDDINETLYKKAMENKLVLRLKGGDPYVYGRGGEEATYLQERNIEFEVIPGISSSLAVPTYAGMPLTYRGISSEIHIFSGHGKNGEENLNFEVISKLDGSLIFMMGIKRLEYIINGLLENGKDINTPIAIIKNGTRKNQEVIKSSIGEILNVKDKLKAPSIILIGYVVNLSEKLDFFTKTLNKKTVLITRSKNQSFNFSENLRENNFNVIEESFIEIKKTDFEYPDFSKYSLLIFNSYNAVKYFFENLEDIRILGNIKIACVGKITAKELQKYKIKPDYLPEKYEFEELMNLISKDFQNKENKILILSSDISPVNTLELKEKYKLNTEKLAVYKTIKLKKTKEEMENLLNKKIDILSFFSSSAVEAFFENLNKYNLKLENIKISSIGQITSNTINNYNYKVDIEANIHTSEELVKRIINS